MLPGGQLMGVGAIIVVLLANVLWFVERRNNPHFQKGYLPGIIDGIWGVMLIIATGEHGDRDTPSLIKRLTVVFMWLFGVVLIAQFTATVTSSLTVQQMQSSIQGPGDLPGKTIATVLPGKVDSLSKVTRDGLRVTNSTSPSIHHSSHSLDPVKASDMPPVMRPEIVAVPIGVFPAQAWMDR
jgi:polar amino acid transport system substrate-binding protein